MVAALGLAACAGDEAPASEVVVSFETDMAVPDSIDAIRVAVQRAGTTLLQQTYTLGAQGDTRLPATLTVAAEDGSHGPVTVSVAGARQGRFRTYRELTTVLPEGRSALLRMPVQWLCDGTVDPDTTNVKSTPRSTCGAGFTCRAGGCMPNQIDDAGLLPMFEPPAVFGGGADAASGACFDTVPCMQSGEAVQPDSHCTIDRPEGPNVNVALRVAADGLCDATGTMCFVPLDGDSTEGFFPVDGNSSATRLQLPDAVCSKLDQGSVRAVYTSTACPMKTAALPPCSTAASVSSERAVRPDVQPTTPPTAAVIATLPVSTQAGSKASVCCSLVADGDALYGCLCDGTSTTDASLYAISPSVADGDVRFVRLLHATMSRGGPGLFSTVAWQGALYSPADGVVMRTELSGTAADKAFALAGGVYDTGSLLADARGVYGLANVTSDTAATSLQVVGVGHDGKALPSLSTGPTTFAPLLQFDQDATAIYLGRNVDPEDAGSGMRQRTSSVIRVPKDQSAFSVVVPERKLVTNVVTRGGYVGLQVDGQALFALFDGGNMDGRRQFELVRADISHPQQVPTPQTILTIPGDEQTLYVALLGVVDGIPVLMRTDSVTTGGSTSSLVSVIAVTANGPKVIADFAGDSPTSGLARDSTRIYWINQKSGDVYAFARAALP